MVKENVPVDPSYKTRNFSILCRLLIVENVLCSKFKFQVTQQINCFVNSMTNSNKKSLQELSDKSINFSAIAIMHAMLPQL